MALIAVFGLVAALALAALIGTFFSPRGGQEAAPAAASPSELESTAPTTMAPTAPTKPADVGLLPDGLFCRDLNAQGYHYAAAVDYWRIHGEPNRMDADRNGIPCETVYSGSDVATYWAGRSTPSPTTAAPDPRPSSPRATPRGALLVTAGPEGGFGQTSPEGRCAVWRTGFVNQSDTAIDKIIVAPPSGEYTNYSGWNGTDFPTRSARRPSPAVLNVYLKPGDDVALEYKTCTSTPPPANPSFEYGATAPKTVTFRWVTGAEGRACFKC